MPAAAASLSLTVPDAVARVRARDPELRAFLRTRLDEALAEHAERARQPARSPLHNVPYALKDMWDTAGIPTTGGSWRFRHRVPRTSAPVHTALSEAGAVMLGKTNLSDLAIVAESANYLRGATCNPHDRTRTAGGSSGGSAAAVAEGMTAFDWGTDFGGSIRLPAAFCGVYGMRLSTEIWPVAGTFPELPASVRYMNRQGPITRDVGTMRAVLDVLRPRLRTGGTRPFAARGALLWVPRGRVAGMWPGFASDAAPALLRALGQVRIAERLPSPAAAHRMALAMWCAHFGDLAAADDTLPFVEGVVAALSAILLRGRLGDRRLHPHTASTLLMLATGRVLLYRDRRAAVAAVERLRAQVAALWDAGWILALPTSGYPAPRHGGSIRNLWLAALVMPGNLIDATALAVPFGRFPDGLPRSLQLWGPPGSENALLDVADRLGA